MSTRYKFIISAHYIDVPVKEVELVCNNGFIQRIDISDEFTADEVYYEFNKALEKMKLEPVPRSAIFSSLAQAVGENMSRHIDAEDIVYVYNNVHMHHMLEPNYPELKLYWAQRYRDKAIRHSKRCQLDHRENQDSDYLESEDRFDENGKYLDVEGNAYSLASNELKRFGGVTKRFNRRDILGIMFRCARKQKSISCAEFCKAMERCVQCIMNPPIINMVRRNPYTSFESLPDFYE